MTTTTTITALGGDGTIKLLRVETDGANPPTYAFHHVDEVSGASVSVANPKPVEIVVGSSLASSGNPVPTSDAAAEAALAAIQTSAAAIQTSAAAIATSTAATAANTAGGGGGSATSALQTAGNTSLATIATNTGAAATAALQTSELTQQTAIATGIGTPADAAWSGSGNSSVVAALKAIWSKLTSTLTVVPPSAVGTDASVAQPTALTTLTSFTVTSPGAYYVQNQSANPIQVIFGPGGNTSTLILSSGGSAGAQGADTSPPMSWFTGLITVAGTAGSQVMARHN